MVYTILDATPGAATANTYVLLDPANQLLEQQRARLTDWFAAEDLDDASDWVVNATTTLGSTKLRIKDGTGSLQNGSVFLISGDVTVYKVTSTNWLASRLKPAVTISVFPPLVAEAAADATITRLTATPKERNLIHATHLLDEAMFWEGSRKDDIQVLRHPRYGLFDYGGWDITSDDIAPILERATAFLAAELIANDRTAESGLVGTGLSKIKVGPIVLDISPTNADQDLIPDAIAMMLASIGHPMAGSGGSGSVVKLTRM